MQKNIINMKITYDSCLFFSENLMLQGKYVEAMQNLNEALELAVKEKRDPFDAYVRILYVMVQTDNYICAVDVYTKLLSSLRDRDHYYMDNVEEFLKDSFVAEQIDDEYYPEGTGRFLNLADIKRRENFLSAQEMARNGQHERFLSELKSLYLRSGKYSPKILEIFLTQVAPGFKGVMKKKLAEELMSLMEAEGEANYAVIEYMLSLNIKKYSDMLEENAQFQLNDLSGSAFELMCVGSAYMKSGKYQTAYSFLRKSLAANAYDEEALWNAALNCYLMGRKEEGRKYLNTYAAMFEVSGVPIDVYRRFMENAPKPVSYPDVDTDFLGALFFDIVRDANEGKKVDYNLLGQILSIAPEKNYDMFMSTVSNMKLSEVNPKGKVNMALRLLSTPRVPSTLKPYMLDELVFNSYEGSVAVVFEQRLYIGILKKLGFNVQDVLAKAYSEIIRLIPFAAEYIPMNCKMLQKVVLEMSERLTDEIIDSREMISTVAFTMLMLYTKKLGVSINTSFYRAYFGVKKNNFTKKFTRTMGIAEVF